MRALSRERLVWSAAACRRFVMPACWGKGHAPLFGLLKRLFRIPDALGETVSGYRCFQSQAPGLKPSESNRESAIRILLKLPKINKIQFSNRERMGIFSHVAGLLKNPPRVRKMPYPPPRLCLQSDVKPRRVSISARTGLSGVSSVSAPELEDSLSCRVKFKSLLCYGDSHFPPGIRVASVENGPNGEN